MKRTRFVLVSCFGAFLGALIFSWLGPKAIAWYFDPPVNMGVSCRSATEWAMTRLLRLQGIGILTGSILAVTLNSISQRKKSNKSIDS